MSDNNRFETIYSQGRLESYRIIVDKETGVNYLYICNGASAGLSPLLDKDGKPIISTK